MTYVLYLFNIKYIYTGQIIIQVLGLSQGGRASHREALPLTVMASHSEAEPYKGRPASNREAEPLTERPGLSKGHPPLTGRPDLSQGGQAAYRQVGLLTGR